MHRRDIIQGSPDFSNAQKRFLIFLMDHEDPDGVVRLPQRDIAQGLGIHQTRIIKITDALTMKHAMWSAADPFSTTAARKAYWLIGDLAANPANCDRRRLYTDDEWRANAENRYYRTHPNENPVTVEG